MAFSHFPSHALHVQLTKSMVSSFIAFALDFAILTFSVEILGLYYLTGGFLGFTCGTTLSYFFSIRWIFPVKRYSNKYTEYSLFFIIGVIGLALNILSLWFFTSIVEIYYLVSRLIGGTLIFFFNFFLRKILLFTNSGKSQP